MVPKQKSSHGVHSGLSAAFTKAKTELPLPLVDVNPLLVFPSRQTLRFLIGNFLNLFAVGIVTVTLKMPVLQGC